MGLFDQVAELAKLKITAYEEKERTTEIGLFEALYNPEDITVKYSISYTRPKAKAALEYKFNKPADLEVKLILDDTGVNRMGIFIGSHATVTEQVQELKRLTYDTYRESHEPNFLKIEWGDIGRGDHDGIALGMHCRLESLSIKYTVFNRDGSPQRAEVTLKVKSDESIEDIKADESSPDVPHSRVVRAGDNLPQLTRAIYGSTKHTLSVARFNNLNHFRNLTPGTELLFPPIVTLSPRSDR